MRTRVAVIGGGQSCEHEVSLASAAGVCAALDPASYDVVPLTIGRDGTWRDSRGRPMGLAGVGQVLRGCQVAFPLVHGPHGEDGSLAALCELAGIRYVGSGVGAGALAMDKWATKLVARELGITTGEGRLVTSVPSDAGALTYPAVVKPVAGGSSHGVTLVRTPDELEPALKTAWALSPRALVEDLVAGREVDVAVLRRADGTLMTSPALEIVCEELFDYDTKYGGEADLRVPAHLTSVERTELEAAAEAMYLALGCSGVARVDFFVTEAGPVLNEVNTTPGLTGASQVPRMFAAAGMSYPALLDELVRGAHR